jgi:pilus assembly protein CpaF
MSAVRKQIASALHMIVYLSRLPDGSRRLMEVAEVVGMEGDVVTMQTLFKFQQTGFDANRKPVGTFVPSGLPPRFLPTLEGQGIKIDRNWFINNNN